MASAGRTIGSVSLKLTPKQHIRNHAERLAYLGDASKIRAYLIDEYGDAGRVPSMQFLTEIIERRKAKFTHRDGQFARR